MNPTPGNLTDLPPLAPESGEPKHAHATSGVGLSSDAIIRSLSEIAASVSSLHSEEDVLWEICDRCMSVLGLVDTVIYLVDYARGVLVQKAAYGAKSVRRREIIGPLEIPIGRGIVGTVAKSGRPEIVADTRLDSRYIEDDAARWSEIAVPIISDGNVIGVIDSEHPDAGFFSVDHLMVLTTMAAICASKLTRARAERKLRELNYELERRVLARTAELTAANTRLLQEKQQLKEKSVGEWVSSQRVRDSDARFRAGFRSLPAHVMLVRVSDRRIIEVNEALVLNSGYSRAEMVGRTTEELNFWADLSERERFFEVLFRQGFVHSFEAGFKAKDGRLDWALVSAEFIELDEEKCIMSLTLPITDRKRAEEELQHALNRERELSRLRSAFVSVVSHEFRTPIGIIHSSAEILERYGDLLGSTERRDHLLAIQTHAWRMAELMEGVLVFGRVEANRMEFRPAEFDLTDSCRTWAKELSRATGHRCPIQVEMAPGLPVAVGDVSLVRHVVSNLLSNAVKYSPASSLVSIELRRRDEVAVLQVSDQGIGIPEADRPRLFQAFERGSNTGSIPGTGLGLVVIRRCLDLHAGVITIEPREPCGTVVTVELPLFPGPAGGPLPPQAEGGGNPLGTP